MKLNSAGGTLMATERGSRREPAMTSPGTWTVMLVRLLLASVLCGLLIGAGAADAQVWRSDQGDGTYRNPPLNADYPDPDIIRVGEDFYFVTTTFVNAPGLTILRSRDLVNWQITTHVVPRLDGKEQYDLKAGGAYRQGLFAASLRHHQGRFHVAVTPVGLNTRIYSADRIEGPWTYVELDREAFDPALFFDDDGQAYLATSIGSDGTITLLTLSPDLRSVQRSQTIHYVKGAEGSKIIKRDGWYYLFNAIPARLGMTVSRSRSLFGPWETREQIDDRTGGHQGALVDLPDGGWYGFVMLDAGAIGRVTNISPVFWQNDWPVWGTPDAPGRVPASAPKPVQGQPFIEPPASDDFTGPELGLQWQWNHNPDDGRWSLTERRGYLRLRPTLSPNLWLARNTLLQKAQAPRGRGVVKLDISNVQPGDRCGFGTFGKYSGQIVVTGAGGGMHMLSMEVTESTQDGPETLVRAGGIPVTGPFLWLRTDTDFTTDRAHVAYSMDGLEWREMGGEFPLAFDWRTGTFQGQQFAIACYSATPSRGYLDVDSFTLSALPVPGP